MYSGSSGGGGGYYESRSSSYGRDHDRNRSSTSGYGSSSGHDRNRYSSSGRSSTHRHSSPSTRVRESSRHHRSPSPGPSHSRYPESRERRRDSSPARQDRHRDKERHSSSSNRRDSEERRRPTVEDNRNVLERMEKSFSDGPLEVFKRCMRDKAKIKIWTRNYKEVRGICTGFVLAFDKHWNIIMRDVDEIYLKPRKGKNPFLRELKSGEEDLIPEMKPKVPKEKKKNDSGKKKSTIEVEVAAGDSSPDIIEIPIEKVSAQGNVSKKNVKSDEEKKEKKEKRRKRKAPLMCKRHVGQLFIRGDNVVMAAVIADVSGLSPSPKKEVPEDIEVNSEN